MTNGKVTQAIGHPQRLVEHAPTSHVPVQSTGKAGNVVLASEDDWRAVQETLYLVSIPGMRESILEGMKTPTTAMSSVLDW